MTGDSLEDAHTAKQTDEPCRPKCCLGVKAAKNNGAILKRELLRCFGLVAKRFSPAASYL
jgi:hypothetical protein